MSTDRPMTLADLSDDELELVELIRSITPEQLVEALKATLAVFPADSEEARSLAPIIDMARARCLRKYRQVQPD